WTPGRGTSGAGLRVKRHIGLDSTAEAHRRRTPRAEAHRAGHQITRRSGRRTGFTRRSAGTGPPGERQAPGPRRTRDSGATAIARATGDRPIGPAHGATADRCRAPRRSGRAPGPQEGGGHRAPRRYAARAPGHQARQRASGHQASGHLAR
ncbi:unnamed protein product, partial [Staurois parvus]